jgi:ATP-binding cassette subfamily F protein 3
MDSDETAYELALRGDDRINVLKHELERIETRMGEPDVYNHPQRLAALLDEQQKTLEEYMDLGGDAYPTLVRATLKKLGLPDSSIDTSVRLLSGGQKKLAYLAGLLMASPEVLLMDEPDNHLDIDGKIALERLIASYTGVVIIVSHDRYLLDAVVTHIADLDAGSLILFRGDYSSYMVNKGERLARQEELYNVQQHEIKRLEAAIKRYSIWAKVYDNEKFANRARAIQGRLDRMEKVDRPDIGKRKVGFKFDGWRGSTKVLEMQDVHKAFGENQLLKDIQLTIRHGERIGLIGPNGTGKTMLFKLIIGIERPDSGEIIVGPNVKIGYYSQESETLDKNQSLLEAVRQAGEMSETAAVAFLMRFLYSYEQVHQPIGHLSGGERSRLQLALMMLSGANFLLLDEPTNNLDISSIEVLENALADLNGTLFVISHDRYFLDRSVGRIIEIVDGRLRDYVGGYSDYALTTAVA